MKAIPSIFLVLLLLSVACRKDAPVPATITFGWFYGECLGETCIETYKLDGEILSEDRNDKYPFDHNKIRGNFAFAKLPQAKYELVKDIELPADLFKLTNGVYGCPDCMDQGGTYIEFRQGGSTRFWYIDNAAWNVPTACADALKAVHEAIGKLQ